MVLEFYEDSDLLFSHQQFTDGNRRGVGCYCQRSGSTPIARGHNGVMYLNTYTPIVGDSLRGWRPVLELTD